jgi:hypothetical protein
MYPQAEPQVIVYRQVEDVGPLKNHSYLSAQGNQVRGGVEDVLPFDDDFALDFYVLDEVVHSVEASQKRRFAAARRTYDCGDIAMGDSHIYIAQGEEIPVMQIQVACFYFCLEAHIYLPVADYPNLPVI